MKFSLFLASFAIANPILMPAKSAIPSSPSDIFTKGPTAVSKFPKALAHTDIVNSLKTAASPDLLKNYIVTLTKFPERYYLSSNGLASAQWIYKQISDLIPQTSSDVVLTVKYFKHSWNQPSIIARLEPKVTVSGATDVVITGSHFDTAANGSPKGEGGPNPAADDCGTGIGVVHETLRVLVANQFVPKRPIEFHFYAAEEVGLFGSNAVAEDYAIRKVNVFSYLNLDQSGYVAKELSKPIIGIFTDFTTKEATDFARLTVAEYTSAKTGNVDVKDSRCGYACTDNAAWSKRGYNAALVFESDAEHATPYNDRVNRDGTPLDTLETVNWNHLQNFVYNTIGYVVELSLAP